MSNYVIIESRDPFESRDVRFVVDTATNLKRKGNDVTVFLLQNAVLAVRGNARLSHLPPLVEEGVRLLADDFSLSERGIQPGEFEGGVQVSSIDALVDMIVRPNTKVIWH